MPADDYALAGGGALKLKGARVTKKKKQSKTKADLDKTVSDASKVVEKLDSQEDSYDTSSASRKTESELRHEEVRKRKLLEMAKQSGAKPELLKTHKERVEELNTYLSKLSEHHDMPKIGPG